MNSGFWITRLIVVQRGNMLAIYPVVGRTKTHPEEEKNNVLFHLEPL